MNIRLDTKRGKLHKELPENKRGSCRCARGKLLQGRLSNRRSEHIQAQTDHKIEGQDAYCGQWCFLAHDGRKVCSLRRKENHTTDQHLPWRSKPQGPNGIVRSRERRGFTSRSSEHSHTESWWKIRLQNCLYDDCAMNWRSYSWQPGGNPTLTKGKKGPSRAVPTISFLSSRSLSSKLLHLTGTSSPG